jgi:hypothetical protein
MEVKSFTTLAPGQIGWCFFRGKTFQPSLIFASRGRDLHLEWIHQKGDKFGRLRLILKYQTRLKRRKVLISAHTHTY